MDSAFTRRLAHFGVLDEEDRRCLAGLASFRIVEHRARRDIVRRGDRTGDVYIIVSGWAYRHTMLEDGRRQILSWMLPGDLCHVDPALVEFMDHSIGTVNLGKVSQVPATRVEELKAERPNIAKFLAQDLHLTLAMQREWTVSLGQRSGVERVAHMLCELHWRLREIDLADDGGFMLPLTQNDIGEALGLTPVHVNRMLRELRERELASIDGRTVQLFDVHALRRLGMFDPRYISIGRREQ